MYEHYSDTGATEDTFNVLATDRYFELENTFYLEIISREDESSSHESSGSSSSMIQFALPTGNFTLSENATTVHIPVQRSGFLSAESKVQCYTAQHTAVSGNDYIDRPRNSIKSLLVFPPGITMLNCDIFIIDDHIFENEEEFMLRLEKISESHEIVLGENIEIMLKITDREDRTKIEFERKEVIMPEPEAMTSTDAASTISVNVGW